MPGKFTSELAEIERMIGAMLDSLYDHIVECYGYDHTLDSAVDNVARSLRHAELDLAPARDYVGAIDNAGREVCGSK